MQDEIRSICSKFIIYGDFLVGVPMGGGHVNDTYQLTYDQGGVRLHYTLQRINHYVFRNPEQVMSNMDRVTEHLLRKIRARHAETRKRTLRLLRTRTNRPFVQDERGNYWRAVKWSLWPPGSIAASGGTCILGRELMWQLFRRIKKIRNAV